MTLANENPPTGRPPVILLVDDNPDNLRILFETLDDRGYDLRIAGNGELAIEIASSLTPDLILLDVMMPGMDGFETCEVLKATDEISDSPVIFLSALDDTASKVRGFDVGAVDFISKPFQAAEVIARVETHITIRRLQKQLASANADLLAANTKMKADLDAAARIQRALLPSSGECHPSIEAAWVYRPCEQVGGDSLNFVRIDEHRVAFFLFDVAGHGVPASMRSISVTKALIPKPNGSSLLFEKAPTENECGIASPKDVVTRLNTHFEVTDESDKFFTIFYGVIDDRDNSLTYVSAGHPTPLHCCRRGVVSTLQPTAPLVGLLPNEMFKDDSCTLSSGDRLIVFSDALIEQHNPSHQEFGRQRVSDIVAANAERAIGEVVSELESSLVAWSGNGQLSDDLSILAIEWK